MNLKHTVLLATVPLMLLTGGTIAWAQSQQRLPNVAQAAPGEAPEGFRGMRGRGMGLPEALNLSTEQSQQIEAIREQARTDAEGLHDQVHQAHEELRSRMASDASVAQIRQQHQQVQNLRQQLEDQRFETMLQIREVLTAEQRSQLAELAQQHQGRHRGPGGPGGFGGPGDMEQAPAQ